MCPLDVKKMKNGLNVLTSEVFVDVAWEPWNVCNRITFGGYEGSVDGVNAETVTHIFHFREALALGLKNAW